MMREVSHPNLLEILEIYEGDNNIYCCGKLYSGESLCSLISDKKRDISQDAINNMAGRMLQVHSKLPEALSYLEDRNIIHRDMKPENIVFSAKGVYDMPVLIDLGFATFEKDFRLLFTRCGTPGYVAPEVLNDKDYTCKADLFSLGVAFFQKDHSLYDGHKNQSFRTRFLRATDKKQSQGRGRFQEIAEGLHPSQLRE